MTETNEAHDDASRSSDGTEPLLKLRGIDKHFGPVQALYGVNLDLPAGQVTGLCGDNGAGKSVLTRCIAYAHQPDHGEIYFGGRPVHIRSRPGTLSALGIETVSGPKALGPTTWTSCKTCSSAGSGCAAGLLDEDSFDGERQAAETLEHPPGHHGAARSVVPCGLALRRPAAGGGGGQGGHVVELQAGALLDEPTAALGVVQTRTVLTLIERLRDRGLAVMGDFANLNDVFEVADRIASAVPGTDGGRRTSCGLRPAERGGRHDDGVLSNGRGRLSLGWIRRVTADAEHEIPTGKAKTLGQRSTSTAADAASYGLTSHLELLAHSLRQYLRAWWVQVRTGNSGVLPVVLAMVLVAIVFEIVTPEHRIPAAEQPRLYLRAEHRLHGPGGGWLETLVLLLARSTCSVGAVAMIRRGDRLQAGPAAGAGLAVVGSGTRCARRLRDNRCPAGDADRRPPGSRSRRSW